MALFFTENTVPYVRISASGGGFYARSEAWFRQRCASRFGHICTKGHILRVLEWTLCWNGVDFVKQSFAWWCIVEGMTVSHAMDA
jgi:hypothetical protein